MCVSYTWSIYTNAKMCDIYNRDIFEFWCQKKSQGSCDSTSIMHFCANKLNIELSTIELDKQLKAKKCISTFVAHLHKKWNIVHRIKHNMEASNKEWLNKRFTGFDAMLSSSSAGRRSHAMLSSPSAGRPSKSFCELTDRSKNRKTQELRSENPTQTLVSAAQASLYQSGKRAASSVLKDMTTSSPTRALKYKKSYYEESKERKDDYADPKLVLVWATETNCSFRKYQSARWLQESTNSKIFPPWEVLKQEKAKCYPDGEIKASDSQVEVFLQDLLNHTVKRIFEIEKVQETISQLENTMGEWTLVSKWGIDGTTDRSDKKFLTIALVPLRLTMKDDGDETVVWENPTPSSCFYCRPLKFIYESETPFIVRREVDLFMEQQTNLRATEVDTEGSALLVTHLLHFTMVDVKTVHAMLQITSTNMCYMCSAKSRDMNTIEKVRNMSPSKESIQFGLSPLHAWINTFQCLLHISYRRHFQKYVARGSLKEEKDREKSIVQRKFKNTLNMEVDRIRQGKGTSNTGNAARKFFKNADMSSEITGIDRRLVQKLGVLLCALSSKKLVDSEKYYAYAMDTAKLYLHLYSWYPMSSTVHKLLFHGHNVIHAFDPLPIGYLSEEALEAQNKEHKLIRESRTRKRSPTETNIDQLHELHVRSDPLISSVRRVATSRDSPTYFEEVEALLKQSRSGYNSTDTTTIVPSVSNVLSDLEDDSLPSSDEEEWLLKSDDSEEEEDSAL